MGFGMWRGVGALDGIWTCMVTLCGPLPYLGENRGKRISDVRKGEHTVKL